MVLTLARNWKLLLAFLAPAILILVPMYWSGGQNGKEPYGAFVILLMAIYWMTECVPLPITAFLPMVLYPLFGISNSNSVTTAYLQDSILFLFGGCVLALSFEYSNIHMRIALRVILLVGASIPQLLLGIMVTTMFLSMWMNNTSTTAMMVPIVGAIMSEFKKKMLESGGGGDSPADPIRGDDKVTSADLGGSQVSLSDRSETSTPESVYPDNAIGSTEIICQSGGIRGDLAANEERVKRINAEVRSLQTMFLVGTAFASNIGGTGVITGSGTNVVAISMIRKDADEPFTPMDCKPFLSISFLEWMMFNVPPMVINTILLWIYMQIHFRGVPTAFRFWRKGFRQIAQAEAKLSAALEKTIQRTMEKQYVELGPINLHEMGVLVLFLIMAALWLLKDPQIIPGWDIIFPKTAAGKSFIAEASPTLLICILLFTIPSKAVYYKEFFNGGMKAGLKDPLLSWNFIADKFPWGIFLLLGGGSAMGVGAKESGLNAWVGTFLASNELLKQCPAPVMLLIILFMTCILTTVASNTATAAIITPVLLGLSYVKGFHPLFLVMSATTACSYAFVLPVSTPPNAIVYSATDLELKDMMLPGFFVSIMTITVLFFCTLTTGDWALHLSSYAGECANMSMLAAAG